MIRALLVAALLVAHAPGPEAMAAAAGLGSLVEVGPPTPLTRARVADLARLPGPLGRRLAAAGLKGVKIVDAPLTRVIGDPWYLDPGNRPRGWDPGSGWDDVASLYDATSKRIFVGNAREGSVSNVLHELGHASGDLLGYYRDPAVLAAHRRCFSHLKPYYTQPGEAGTQEFWAEAFATYFKQGPAACAAFADPAFAAFFRRLGS